MKALLAYYSFSGNNEALALELQKRLNCTTLRIAETRKRTKVTILVDLLLMREPRIRFLNMDLDDYDHVILLTPIWAGKIAAPMRTFVRQQAGKLKAFSFITLCGGQPGQEEKIKNELFGLTGKSPTAVTQLKIVDLLKEGKQGQAADVSAYRIDKQDWQFFSSQIDIFLGKLAIVKRSEQDIPMATPIV